MKGKLTLKMLLEEEGEEEGEEEIEEPAPENDADDEAVDDEGDTATEEEEDVEIDPEDEVQFNKPLEAQVDSVLADFELAAVKTAKVNESTSFSLKTLINEVTEEEFDVHHFASDVSRLLDNYETLLDIESAIYYRAIAILEKNYGDETAATFRDIMSARYKFDFGDVRSDPIKDQAPLALGAGGEGAGGA